MLLQFRFTDVVSNSTNPDLNKELSFSIDVGSRALNIRNQYYILSS